MKNYELLFKCQINIMLFKNFALLISNIHVTFVIGHFCFVLLLASVHATAIMFEFVLRTYVFKETPRNHRTDSICQRFFSKGYLNTIQSMHNECQQYVAR